MNRQDYDDSSSQAKQLYSKGHLTLNSQSANRFDSHDAPSGTISADQSAHSFNVRPKGNLCRDKTQENETHLAAADDKSGVASKPKIINPFSVAPNDDKLSVSELLTPKLITGDMTSSFVPENIGQQQEARRAVSPSGFCSDGTDEPGPALGKARGTKELGEDLQRPGALSVLTRMPSPSRHGTGMHNYESTADKQSSPLVMKRAMSNLEPNQDSKDSLQSPLKNHMQLLKKRASFLGSAQQPLNARQTSGADEDDISQRSKSIQRSQQNVQASVQSIAQQDMSLTSAQQRWADRFKNALAAKLEDRLVEEIMDVSEAGDATPDLVEGIFYIDKTPYADRCCKKKEDRRAKQKIVVHDRCSLFLFDHETRFRKWIVQATGDNLFEAIIVLAIFLNSMVLAVTDYSDRLNEGSYNQLLERIGTGFSIFFTLEFVLKVIAMGFIAHRKSYMRDPWNWLDFLVVATGLIELAAGDKGAQSVRALRVLRVLRPLKSINAFPKMRRLIGALLSSLPNLGNAVFFMLFIFLLFGIFGVQQFGGAVYQRCRFTDRPLEDGTWPIDEEIAFVCSKDGSGNFECPEGRYCRSPLDAGLGLEIDDLQNDELVDYGITVFDNLGIGLITVFQMITLEGWTKIMYNLMDSNISWMAVIFCVFLVLIGSFFLLNVILAVLAEALNNVDEIQLNSEAKANKLVHESLERRKLQDIKKNEQLALLGLTPPPDPEANSKQAEPTNKQDEDGSVRPSLIDGAVIKDESAAQNNQSHPQELQSKRSNLPDVISLDSEFDEEAGFEDDHVRQKSLGHETFAQHDNPYEEPSQSQIKSQPDDKSSNKRMQTIEISSSNFFSPSDSVTAKKEDLVDRKEKFMDASNEATYSAAGVSPLTPILMESSHGKPSQYASRPASPTPQGGPQRIVMQPIQEISNDSQRDSGRGVPQETDRNLIPKETKVGPHEFNSKQLDQKLAESAISAATTDIKSGLFSIQSMLPERARKNCLYKICYIVCSHFMFTLIITILIILNTAALAMDSYPKHLEREYVANLMNDIFSWCFLAEMIIKLLGLGAREYARDSFNIFDAALVIISLVDYVLSQIPQISGGSGGALSAFRGVRLLRVFKLARSWTSFRTLLAQIVLTVKEISTFAILLIICMFIFTLLGMETFGHRIKLDAYERVIDLTANPGIEGTAPRPNFDSFYMAFTSIFIVFIGEDWQIGMHSHYRVEGGIALAYFPLLYIFLHLILLNLFLAIILQNFDTGAEEDSNNSEEKTLKRFIRKLKNICRRCKGDKNSKVKPGGSIRRQSFSQSEANPEEDNKQAGPINVEELASSFSSGTIGGSSITSKSDYTESEGQESVYSDKSSIQKQEMVVEGEQNGAISLDSQSVDELERSALVRQPFASLPSLHAKQQEQHPTDSLSGPKSLVPPDRQSVEKPIPSLGKESKGSKLSGFRALNAQASNSLSAAAEQNRESLSQLGQDLRRAKSSHFTRKSQMYRRHSTRKNTKARRQQRVDLAELKARIKAKESLLSSTAVDMSLAKTKYAELFETKRTSTQTIVTLIGKSCGIFGPSNPVRRLAKAVVEFKYFDTIIMSLIAASTILLTLDNPLHDKKSAFAQALSGIDYVMTVAFTLECILHILVRGFVFNGPDSYLKDSWNVLDFMIVLFSLISIATVSLNLEIIKLFRMLRVLRPLRVLKRNFGLKIQVVSLLNSIPGVVNLLAITMLLLMLFGIQGVNFFAGKMYYCNMANLPESVHSKIVSEWDCCDYGGEWMRLDSNFDNVGQAMLTMFTMMTTEGWIGVMWLAVDATAIHQVPERDFQPAYILFFIAFLVFGALFILNLFVGVVLGQFSLEKDKLSNNNKLTRLQKEYLEVMQASYMTAPQLKQTHTGNRLRDLCKDISESDVFNYFILICIVLNSVILAITWYGEPKSLVNVMEIINLAFTLIYTLEMITKLIAYQRNYFRDGWNVFDAMIVFFAIVGIVSKYGFDINVGALTTVVRAFRILRVLKLIRKAKNLQKILSTFLLAIPELANVGALLFLFLFLFSVLGVFLFSGIKLQDNLNKQANFQNFGSALMTLFRITTGEGWQDIMYDSGRSRGILFQCKDDQTYEEQQRDGINGCGSSFAYIYFVSFMLVVSLIFLNLFIAIILEGQHQATALQDARVGEAARNSFARHWKNYDPDATGMISIDDIQDFICDLCAEEFDLKAQTMIRDPGNYFNFNFTSHNQVRVLTKIARNYDLTDKEERIKNMPAAYQKLEASFQRFICNLKLPIYNKFSHYNFHDVLSAFVQRVFQDTHQVEYDERQSRIEAAKAIGQENELRAIDNVDWVIANYDMIDALDFENFLEADDPSFQSVINRLENKGSSDCKILKLNEVRKLRIKAGAKLKSKLLTNIDGDFILDSSVLFGARRILKFVREYKARKAREAEKEAAKAAKAAAETKGAEQNAAKPGLNLNKDRPDGAETKDLISIQQLGESKRSVDPQVLNPDAIITLSQEYSSSHYPSSRGERQAPDTIQVESLGQAHHSLEGSQPKEMVIAEPNQKVQSRRLMSASEKPGSASTSHPNSAGQKSERKQQDLKTKSILEKRSRNKRTHSPGQREGDLRVSSGELSPSIGSGRKNDQLGSIDLRDQRQAPQDSGREDILVSVRANEFDELVIPRRQGTNVMSEAMQQLQKLRSDSSGLEKKSLQSRDGGAHAPKTGQVGVDDDKDGGMPNVTEPSQTPVSELDDRLSLTQSQNQFLNPDQALNNVRKFKVLNSKLDPTRKRKKYKLQLDSKGGEAASATKTHSGEILQANGTLLDLEKIRKQARQDQKTAILKKIQNDNSSNYLGMGSIRSASRQTSKQETIRKAPSSRVFVSYKQTPKDSLNDEEGPQLQRSRTTAGQKKALPFRADSKPISPEHRLTPSKMASVAQTNTQTAEMPSNPQSIRGRGEAGNSPVDTTNYRAGTLQKRSQDRKKRMIDAYRPQVQSNSPARRVSSPNTQGASKKH